MPSSLAQNQNFWFKAAQHGGLSVPRAQLSAGMRALVIERFYPRADGDYRSLEDFSVLNGLRTAEPLLLTKVVRKRPQGEASGFVAGFA